MADHFEPVMNVNYRLVTPPTTRRTAIGGYPKVTSYDMLAKQLHCSNPVKHVHYEFFASVSEFVCQNRLAAGLFLRLEINAATKEYTDSK